MNFVYVSGIIDSRLLDKITDNGKKAIGFQAQKFNRLLAEGLGDDKENKVFALSSIPVSGKSYGKLAVKEKSNVENNVAYHYISTVLLPVVKNFVTCINSKKLFKKLALKNSDTVLLFDALTVSAARGALNYAAKNNIPSIAIITDLPMYLSGGAGSRLFEKLFMDNLKKCHGFILLTEAMKDRLPIGNKPYMVMEGLCESSESGGNFEKISGLCLYAGGLEECYGSRLMLEAFKRANLPNVSLKIYGTGSDAPFVKNFCEENSFAEYCGVAKNTEISELERKAELLINPRTSAGDFTKYSFPSKDMEYLASGTPTLAFMLPGIPKEYGNYFIVPESETAEGMSAALKDYFALDKSAKEKIGLNGRKFVTENKNKAVQGKRVSDFSKKILCQKRKSS